MNVKPNSDSSTRNMLSSSRFELGPHVLPPTNESERASEREREKEGEKEHGEIFSPRAPMAIDTHTASLFCCYTFH